MSLPNTDTQKEEKQEHPSGFRGDLCGLRKRAHGVTRREVGGVREFFGEGVPFLSGGRSLPDAEVPGQPVSATGGIPTKGRAEPSSQAREARVCC